MNQKEEQTLRENIRQLIRHVKDKKAIEQKKFNQSIKELAELELVKMLQEREVADVDPAPNKSTGINVLEDLLKKIVPVLQTDDKSMTTSFEQRESFRAHIVKAIVDTLTPVEVNNEAGEEAAVDESVDVEEAIDIDIVDDGPESDEKFIDIRTDAEKEAEKEPVDPRDEFGIQGADATGRNMAFNTFNKIETSIIDSYELLENPEDQEFFYDYLIANTKLYFDKFEAELSPNITEPTNQAYDTAREKEPIAELHIEL